MQKLKKVQAWKGRKINFAKLHLKTPQISNFTIHI